MQLQTIQNRIYEAMGQKVMLDFDLAELYEVPTKALNQAIKRNAKRFPIDFMFRLTESEWDNMRSQIVTASQRKRNVSATPYAFTEQGVAMLSGVLNSEIAINMNIAIMRAFVEVRKILLAQTSLKGQLKELRERLGEHDVQLNEIYDTIENLLDENATKRKWGERKKIGFSKK
jgi:phage regulator Rha-like protein